MEKKQIVVIILCIILVVGFGVGIYFYFSPEDKEEVNNEKEIISQDELNTLISTNHQLAVLLFGNIQVEEGFITTNNEEYHLYADQNIGEITINTVNDLIKENLVIDTSLNYINREGNNKYMMTSNQIYVKKGTKTCDIPDYDIKDITYEKISDTDINIRYQGKVITASKIDNKWYMNGILFTCD